MNERQTKLNRKMQKPTIQVYLTPEQKKDINFVSNQLGLCASSFIRSRILKEVAEELIILNKNEVIKPI